MKRPPNLSPGDKIGLSAPARKINRNELSHAISTMQKQGYEVVYNNDLFAVDHQFAGDDDTRAAYFQSLLDDESVKAIISVRGGYGSVRIIDKLNFTQFRKKPKWIIGYSDATVFLNHINKNSQVETLHASMPINFESNTDAALSEMFDILKGGTPVFQIPHHHLNKKGKAKGLLCGGNLSVLYSLMGSKSFPKTKNNILFIEDLDEYLYHIDRMIVGLKRAGVFEGLKGLIVGAMTDMNDNSVPFGKTAEEIIRDHLSVYDFPVCYGFPAGHIDDNRPLIMGSELDLEINNEVLVKFKPKALHMTLGIKGEALARTYLKEKGYKILETNWRKNKDEIDIIAMDKNELVFVEVKTRGSDLFGEPEEAVGPAKEKSLIRAAEAYIEENDMDINSRFDIVSVILNKKEQKMKHIEDAFYPE